jgi:hypothetical protein
MGLARTSDDRPRTGIGFLSALICNISLLALALGGALLTIEYGRPNLYSYEISDASLEATRAEIDKAAAALPAEGIDRRAYWGKLVKASVDRADLDCAKGYLLLAPQMLPPEDGQALNRALTNPRVQAAKTRSADLRMIQAAALLLPPASLTAWTDATTEPEPMDAFLANPLQSLVNMATDAFKPAEAPPPPDPFLLDEPDTLADAARRLLLGERVDELRFKLTGFVQFLPGSKLVATGDGNALRNAASVVLGARAGKHLPPGLAQVLTQRLDAALPDKRLRENILDASTAPNAKNDPLAFAKALDGAFEQSADENASDDLVSLLKRINAIANSTSEKGAADLLRHADTDSDLARLQLTAQAGGLRVVALSDRLDKGVLDLANGVVTAAALALIGVFGFTLFQSIGGIMEKRNRENQRMMFDSVIR